MKTKKVILIFSLICLLLASCSTSGQKRTSAEITDIDSLILRTAQKTAKLLLDQDSGTLAVYYFTVDGLKSPLSDFLIGSITTEMANQLNKSSSAVKVVSRQNLDQLIEEMKFQISGFVDEDSQISLGKQLGADIILTGAITPVDDYYKLNAQLISVEDGVVLGGFIFNFRVEEDLARQISPDMSGISEIIITDNQKIQKGGLGTETTVFESFDQESVAVDLSASSDGYGEVIIYASEKVKLAKDAGLENSSCAVMSLNAEFDSFPLEKSWEDAYLNYYLLIDTGKPPADFDGLAVSIKPDGFSSIGIRLVQYENNERNEFFISLSLLNNEWQTLKIPFALFDGDGKTINPDLPVFIQLDIDYLENYRQYFFRDSQELAARLLVDNIGFFKAKGKAGKGLLENFADEINQMVFQVHLYGTTHYTAYELAEGLSEEEAEEIDLLVPVEGIESQKIDIRRMSDGPDGDYLQIYAELEIDEAFGEFINKYEYYSMTLFVRTGTAGSWKNFNKLNFYIKSDTLAEGGLETVFGYFDSEEYFTVNIEANPFWKQIEIPFSDFYGNERTLAENDDNIKDPWLQFFFDIPHEELLKAVKTGKLEIDLAFDSFSLD